jgi:hypothetical protein
VYALGVVLYELLIGRSLAPTDHDAAERAALLAPVPEPPRRHADAEALADELGKAVRLP